MAFVVRRRHSGRKFKDSPFELVGEVTGACCRVEALDVEDAALGRG